MALNSRDVIDRGMQLLHQGLAPYVKRELDSKRVHAPISKDPAELLGLMLNNWDAVFRQRLGQMEQSWVHELKATRNKWAHHETLVMDDAKRALDTIARLLTVVGATAEAELAREVEFKIVQQQMADRAQKRAKRAAESATEGEPSSNFKHWRAVIAPHPDVATGKYQQAEFAADLWQVHTGKAAEEYGDARKFFERTFLTAGLKALLVEGVKRLSGLGGIPVFELQTNFGGGKTHNLLALYHLFGGEGPDKLLGIPELLQEAGVGELPPVSRAVIVGTQAVSPGDVSKKKDGTVVHTLWGEIAWQLGDKAGYEMVRAADESATPPGQALTELFEKYAPCMVLIDEWVAYARLLHGEPGLPGGTFGAQMTFAQTLTEAAKAAPQTLVVISLPESKKELGGELGEKAHEIIRNILARIDSPWHPAAPEESFEIVRRRLFQAVEDAPARDAVCRAFSDMYQKQKSDFPGECAERAYLERMQRCYPIHPELFDRLYSDWAALEKFQQTRGVLRLMAKVIQALHDLDDKNLLIMPGMVPLANEDVSKELLHYLDTPWQSVLNTDVDAEGVTSHRIDAANNTFGRYHACRRVARTLFLGSAPRVGQANQGLEDRQVRLGCVQPGESVPTFGDALKKLSEQALHLYLDKQRYWFDTKRSVNRIALERADQKSDDDVWQELATRLDREKAHRGHFKRVHPCPASSADVPDDMDCKLVILHPQHPHATKNGESEARKVAGEILDNRGGSPRRYRNTLVFLAADKRELEGLADAVRKYLAWDSIYSEKGEDGLNLDAYQANLAKNKREEHSKSVDTRIKATYKWLLVAEQPEPNGPESWVDKQVKTDGHLAENAGAKLEAEQLLVVKLGHSILRADLDRIPLWRGDHVAVKELEEFYASYLYLHRLRDADVLHGAIRGGLGALNWDVESFAYADRYDDATGKYEGLRPGGKAEFYGIRDGLLVKPEVAQKQLDAVKPPEPPVRPPIGPGPVVPPGPQPDVYRRFHGRRPLDLMRWLAELDPVMKQVAQRLDRDCGAKVKVFIEIEAELPDGVADKQRLDITEDCNSLKIDGGFEKE